MSPSYRVDAPKRAVNLSLNADLLKRGKDLGLNLSAIAEAALAQAIRTAQAEAWLRDNAEGIHAFNDHVARKGVFSDELRSF